MVFLGLNGSKMTDYYQEAFRLYQRRPKQKSLSKFGYMKVGSANDWNVNLA